MTESRASLMYLRLASVASVGERLLDGHQFTASVLWPSSLEWSLRHHLACHVGILPVMWESCPTPARSRDPGQLI